MKKQSKTILLAAIMAMAVPPGLRADKGIVILRSDGEKTGYSFDKLQQITFANGQMMCQLQDATEAVSLVDIEEITFGEVGITGTEIVKDLSDGLSLTVADGIVTVSIADNAPLSVIACDINGRVLFSTETDGSTRIDLRREPAGIYIIKANNKLIKFNKK